MARRKRVTDLAGLARLQGKRLHLRPPAMTDAEAVYAYASDPAVTRFLAWPQHRTLVDSERFLETALQGWQGGHNLVWLIEDASGVVGAIGARLSGANAGIGYVLARACWGKGYATEALQLLSEALFCLSPVRALWAYCVTENGASARVLEKSGFHFERLLPNYFTCPNLGDEVRDVMLYVRHREACRET